MVMDPFGERKPAELFEKLSIDMSTGRGSQDVIAFVM